VIGARHADDLEALAADLRPRHGVAVTPSPVDLYGPADALQCYVDECFTELGPVDAVLVTAGAVDDADDGTAPAAVTDTLVRRTSWVS
jgi:short-subunit dehydrogenase